MRGHLENFHISQRIGQKYKLLLVDNKQIRRLLGYYIYKNK